MSHLTTFRTLLHDHPPEYGLVYRHATQSQSLVVPGVAGVQILHTGVRRRSVTSPLFIFSIKLDHLLVLRRRKHQPHSARTPKTARTNVVDQGRRAPSLLHYAHEGLFWRGLDRHGTEGVKVSTCQGSKNRPAGTGPGTWKRFGGGPPSRLVRMGWPSIRTLSS